MRTFCTAGYGQDILRIFLWNFQHASGLSKPLLEYLNQRSLHLKGHYNVYLRKFLTAHKMQIECTCVTSHKLEQENGVFLMDEVCTKIQEGIK